MKLHALFSGVRKRWLVQLVILGLIISALNVGNVLVLDTLWHDAEFNNLVLFLLLGIGAYLLTIVESYLGEKFGQHYLKDIRHQLYTELMSPKNEQPPRRLGVSMSRMITDSNNIKNWASLGAATLVTSGFSFIGYLVLIFYLWPSFSWQVSWVVAGLFSLSLALTPRLTELALTLRTDRGRLSGHLCERIMGYQSVNQFRQIKREGRRLNRCSVMLGDTSKQNSVFQAVLTQQTAMWFCILLALLFTHQVWQEHPVGQNFGTLMLIIGLLFNALRDITISWGYAITYYVAKERLELAMSRTRGNYKRQIHQIDTDLALCLCVKNFSVPFSGENLSVNIFKGRSIDLSSIDPINKTAICTVLSGIVTDYMGDVALEKMDIRTINNSSLRRYVYIIDEQCQLFRGTVLTNIRYGNRRVSDEEVSSVCLFVGISPERLDCAVAEFGRHLDKTLYNQILIARVLLSKPKLIVLNHHGIGQDVVLMRLLKVNASVETYTLLSLVRME